MKRLWMILALLGLMSTAQAVQQVWTCTGPGQLGGKWAVPSLTVYTEFCPTTTACGNVGLNGAWVSGVCKLPPGAGPGEAVHASNDGGTTGSWIAKSAITAYNPPPGGGGSGPTPPPYSRSVTLAWTSPTSNVDGSPLTDLASYNVYMGAIAANLLTVGNIKVPGLSFTTNPLTVGNYVFTVTAVSSSGVESAQSAQVAYTVAPPPTPTPKPPTGLQATGN